MVVERVGDWIQTYSGIPFYPLDPLPEDVRIEDIAHALSNQCRWTGHTKKFYSVAEHSVRTSWLLRDVGAKPEVILWGLLHDASEAYICDIARPVKRSDVMAGYREAEKKLMDVIMKKFNLPLEEPAEVRWADNVLLGRESVELMTYPAGGWSLKDTNDLAQQAGITVNISGWLPYNAKHEFLEQYKRLT